MDSDDTPSSERDTIPIKAVRSALLTDEVEKAITARAADYIKKLRELQSGAPNNTDNLAAVFALTLHCEATREATRRYYGEEWLAEIDRMVAPHIRTIREFEEPDGG